jgi:hypothetical protein
MLSMLISIESILYILFGEIFFLKILSIQPLVGGGGKDSTKRKREHDNHHSTTYKDKYDKKT